MAYGPCTNCRSAAACTTMKLTNGTGCPCSVCIVRAMCRDWCDDSSEWWGDNANNRIVIKETK